MQNKGLDDDSDMARRRTNRSASALAFSMEGQMICKVLFLFLACTVVVVGCSNDSRVKPQQAVPLTKAEFSLPSIGDLLERNGRLYLKGAESPFTGAVRSADDTNVFIAPKDGLWMKVDLGVRDVVRIKAVQEPGSPAGPTQNDNWDKALIDRWETD